MTLVYIIIFSLLGSAGALLGAGVILLFPAIRERLRAALLSYAIGTLLGATFLSLLPNAIESLSAPRALSVTLLGLLGFFFLEKVLRLSHAHGHSIGHDHPEAHRHEPKPVARLVLIGDALHNFVDGVLIATAFLTSVPLGIATAFAVIIHEVPQELGDFVILLEGGLSPRQAYFQNFMAALSTVVGAILTYAMKQSVLSISPYVLAISAGSFLYIATVDLAPILHHPAGIKASLRQAIGLIGGVVSIALLQQLMHD